MSVAAHLDAAAPDAAGRDDEHLGRPARHDVAPRPQPQDVVCHARELVRAQVGRDKPLARPQQVLGRCPGADEALAVRERADRVHRRDVGLAVGLEPRDDGLDEEGGEAVAVEERRRQLGQRPRRDGALLAQLVQPDEVAERRLDRRDVRREPRQPQEAAGPELEDLAEVPGQRLVLDTQPHVAGDGDRVAAADRDERGAVVRLDVAHPDDWKREPLLRLHARQERRDRRLQVTRRPPVQEAPRLEEAPARLCPHKERQQHRRPPLALRQVDPHHLIFSTSLTREI